MVPALGYLDKINELIKKAQDNELSNAEFIILKDFDLAELRSYQQAKDLTIDLEALLDKLRMIDGVKRLEVLGQV